MTMRLTPTTTPCEIYVDGFGDSNFLGRKEVGQKLTELVDRVEDSMVVALDGPWGSGKSFFLQRWVGAHSLEFEGKATTVYLDAFKSDYLDDPLIALTSAIAQRFENESEPDRRVSWGKAKKSAVALSGSAFRVGLRMGTAGLYELAGPIIEAALGSASEDIENWAEDTFWKQERSRKSAMDDFRSALEDLTVAGADGEESRSLVIVVDELDRCRPDYALAMLEVAKHFFSVPRVHFVLGVNMDAMKHIVRVRYGAKIDAGEYLKRFVTVRMVLPKHADEFGSRFAAPAYFDVVAYQMGIPTDISRVFSKHLDLAAANDGISLRDVEKLLTRIVLLPNLRNLLRGDEFDNVLRTSLVVLHAVRPELYEAAMKGTLQKRNIDSFYGLMPELVRGDGPANSSSGQHQLGWNLSKVWSYVIDRDTSNSDLNAILAGQVGDVGAFLARADREFFSTFSVNR